jgi:DNA replication protein DnaC
VSYESNILRNAAARLRARSERHAREIHDLRSRLYREQPGLARLDAELRRTMIEVAELALSGERNCDAKLEEIRTRNLALQQEREELLRGLGYGPAALDDAPLCSKCRDTGWIGAKMCSCLSALCAEEQIRELSKMLDLGGQSFDKARLDVYSDRVEAGQKRSSREHMKQVISFCEGYARQFGTHPVKNLFFSGGTGLGKTFLSACIAREVSAAGYSVVYDTAINIFATFEARQFAREADQEREARGDARRYLNCDLLILDDLGSEMTTQMVNMALYELVNSRLMSGKRTVISSNLSMDEVRARYTPQIASRLEGEYREIAFYGEDIRLGSRR